jgi:hypothetical protein
MAVGTTNTGSLGDSQEFIVDSGRNVREFEGVYKRTCEVQKLSDNTGLTWDEISLGQLTAQAITETTELDNPQTITDSLLTITPAMVGIEICVTDRVYRRLPKVVIGKMGGLAQNAIERLADEDYLSTFASATTTLSGTGTTLAHGVLAAGKVRITSNVTEGAVGQISFVGHGYQIKDLADEIRAGVGTYTIPNGATQDVLKNGFMGMTIDGINIFEDGNITIDATPDARGGVHAKEAIICVKGESAWTESKRRPELGGGADDVFYYDEYQFGERGGGLWLYGVLSDATLPTN